MITLPQITFGRIVVEYHGSLSAFHGRYVIEEDCDCKSCDLEDAQRKQHGIYLTAADVRLVLVNDQRRIHHVGQCSVTVTER